MLEELKSLRDDLSLTLEKLQEEHDVAEVRGEADKAKASEPEIERIKILLANVQFAINKHLSMNMNAVAAELEESIRAQRAIGISSALETISQLINRLRANAGHGSATPLHNGSGPSAEPGGRGPVPNEPPSGDMNKPDPTPGGSPGRFVQARNIATKTILYVDAAGREFLREGGSRSWRNFNPGNIRKGNFSKTAGAIGDDGAFAIFPDLKTGVDAIVTLLRSNEYTNLSLRDAVFRYAPPNENNSSEYAAFLERETRIAGTTVLSSLTVAQTRGIAKVIQRIEGWHEGIERSDRPAFEADATSGISSAAGAALDWMDIAAREAALPENERSEWSDPGDNPRILNYFKVGCSWFDPAQGDEVDWCAAFVNYCLVTAGYMGTNHPGARSFFWNKKRQFVSLAKPRFGAVAVRRYAPFTDPTWETGNGHVGFVKSWTSTSVTLLGGNQSRTVRTQAFPLVTKNAAENITSEFVAFMMPVMN